MRTFTLNEHPAFTTSKLPHFAEHSGFTSNISRFEIPEHQSAFGLIVPMSGMFRVWINGVQKSLSSEEFLIVNEKSKVRMSGTKASTPFMLYFQSRMLETSGQSDWNLVERVYPSNETFRKRIAVLHSLPASCSSFVAMQGDSIVRSILSDIIEYDRHSVETASKIDVKKASTRDENYKKIAAIREWMEDHFHEQVSLNDLSLKVGMNHQHFLRMFARLFQKTPRQYLIDLKLAEAKRLLQETPMIVEEICQAVGWNSLGTFSDMFKQRTGLTPGEFRKNTRQ